MATLITNHISVAGNAIASFRLSERPLVSILQNRLTVDLELLRVSRSRPWLAGD